MYVCVCVYVCVYVFVCVCVEQRAGGVCMCVATVRERKPAIYHHDPLSSQAPPIGLGLYGQGQGGVEGTQDDIRASTAVREQR